MITASNCDYLCVHGLRGRVLQCSQHNDSDKNVVTSNIDVPNLKLKEEAVQLCWHVLHLSLLVPCAALLLLEHLDWLILVSDFKISGFCGSPAIVSVRPLL